MDNLPAHKVKGVSSIIKDAGARVIYLFIPLYIFASIAIKSNGVLKLLDRQTYIETKLLN